MSCCVWATLILIVRCYIQFCFLLHEGWTGDEYERKESRCNTFAASRVGAPAVADEAIGSATGLRELPQSRWTHGGPGLIGYIYF